MNYICRLPEFTHGGKWQVVDDWRNDANGVAHQLLWTKEDVEGQIKKFEVSIGVRRGGQEGALGPPPPRPLPLTLKLFDLNNKVDTLKFPLNPGSSL